MSYKNLVIGGLLVSTSILLSGCDIEETLAKTQENIEHKVASITIPFEWFREDSEKIEAVIPNIKGLNLSEEEVYIEEINDFSEKIANISGILAKEDKFEDIAEGKRTIFNVLGSEYLDMKYGEVKDDLSKTIQEIGKVPYQFVKSLTLRQYGVRLDEKGDIQRYAVVDVNAVNDTEDFRIQPLMLKLDESGTIYDSVKMGKNFDQPHTNTPLTKESLLFEDTHQEFKHLIEKTIQTLANTTIYSKIKLNEIKPDDPSITALLKNIGVEEKNKETVFELIQRGKGDFSSWGITGYLFDDKNVNGKTYYELAVADEEGVHYYTVHYHRGLKQITNISKDSPFKEVF